ncbi:YdcH family protein [Azonexus sp. IMCC34839]|uniref:YdcH family protein n=1 Tax=Azonexus sp. IMCC34839 TaxID=3133695 RepID=UPI00399B070A
MALHPLSDMEVSEIRAQLHELKIEHRDLDQVISHLIENPPPDDLLIRRLKKRKLLLKDRILQLEQMLIPDIPA